MKTSLAFRMNLPFSFSLKYYLELFLTNEPKFWIRQILVEAVSRVIFISEEIFFLDINFQASSTKNYAQE